MIIKVSVTTEQRTSLYLYFLVQASTEARRGEGEIPRAGGAGGCESPDIGAGKQTVPLCKSSKLLSADQFSIT